MLALAVGTLSPAVGAAAATPARLAGPGGSAPSAATPPDSFGARLVDVPVSEADNPRALHYIIDYLPVGAVIHRRIQIENGESRPATFTVYPDAATIANGQFVGDAGETRNELTTWISVQHPTVTLAPKASVMDMITIGVPVGATRGEHYGVIWVQQTSAPHTTPGYGVIEVSRVGIRIYLAVGRGGAPPTVFTITSITANRSARGQPVITADVDNTGGRAVDLSGSASLADGPGGSSAGPFPAQHVVTLAPGQKGSVTFAPPKSLPNGSWRATIVLASGLTTATATASIRFSAFVAAAKAKAGGLPTMEWVWIALGILAVVAALAALAWYFLMRRRVPTLPI
jgi:hypothetical protein